MSKTFADIYCGSGALSLGFKHAGFNCLFGLDNSPIAAKAYELNVGKAICIDVRNFDAKHLKGTVYVLIGSSPCQSFSKANIHTRVCDMTLTNEFLRLVDQIEPQFWILENVPEIVAKVGTSCIKTEINCSDYGFIQQRKRAFISNFEINLDEPQNKYLSREQEQSQREFRSIVIHKPYQTITCRYNSFNHTDAKITDERGVRVLNHLEAMQIQGFPFYYKLPEEATQREIETLIGNAVPPSIAYQIALSIQKLTLERFH